MGILEKDLQSQNYDRAALSERVALFRKHLGRLEAQLDKGFFLSFVGRIVVDEKKIYSILSELRAIDFDAVAKGAVIEPADEKPHEVSPDPVANEPVVLKEERAKAQMIRREADEYAEKSLAELEAGLEKALEAIRSRRNEIKERKI